MTTTPEQTSEIAQLQSPWWFRFVPGKVKLKIQDRIHLLTASDALGWLVIDTAFTMGLSFVISFLLARTLGPAQFGYYSYLLAFFSLFLPLSKLGLANLVIRNLAQNKVPQNETLGTTFGLRLLASIGTLVAATIGMMILRPTDVLSQSLMTLLGLMTIFQSFEVIEYFFQSQLSVKQLTLAKLVTATISTFFKFIAIILHSPVYVFVVLLAVEACILAIALSFVYLQSHAFATWRFNTAVAKNLLRQSFPLVFSSMVIMGYGQADQLFLNYFKGSAELGQYAVALTLVNGLALLPVVLHRAIAPVIMKINFKTQQQLFRNQLLQIYRFVVVTAIIVTIGMILAGPVLIHRLYGAAYSQAGQIIVLLPFRFFFVSFGIMRALFIVSHDLFDFDLLTNLAGLVISVVISIALVPVLGIYGSLIASFVSLLTSTFLIDLFHPQLRLNAQIAFHAMLTPHKLTFSKQL